MFITPFQLLHYSKQVYIQYLIYLSEMQFNSSKQLKVLERSDLYHHKAINIQKLMTQITECSILERNMLKEMIRDCKKVALNEPNIVELTDPVTIVGDIHGQLYDLLKILTLTDLDKPQLKTNHKVIFLGDYVDRGLESLEVIILLMCLKIEHPKEVILLRGNHQSRAMTQQYNFMNQCVAVYGQQIYNLFMQLFDSFPLACIVNKSYFCVHGGISQKHATIGMINSIQRVCEIPLANVLHCDLIWADPTEDKNGRLRNRVTFNFARDCSIVFGAVLLNQFLKENNLKTVIRAHQVFLQGYNLHKWNKNNAIPPLITIFSAPNYCGTYNNKGAILKIEENQMKIKQIKEHQPERHRCLTFDVFSWTIDEIMKNVNDIAKYLTKCFLKKTCPELKDKPLLDQGILLYRYAIEQKKVQMSTLKVTSTSITKVQMTEEEERNFLFNRSIDYYGETQKLHRRK